jgi:hypothetical protein
VIQTLLFVAGINTLCQSFFGTRLPAVMGGSYTVVAPTISIIFASRYSNETDPHQVIQNKFVVSIASIYVILLRDLQDFSHCCLCRNSCGPCEGHKALSSLHPRFRSYLVSVASGAM